MVQAARMVSLRSSSAMRWSRWGPLRCCREAVLDPVDPQPAWVAVADRAHERERVGARMAAAKPQAQPVAVNVEGTEAVAHAVTAVERRTQPLGTLAACPTRAVRRAQADRSHLIEADDHTVIGLGFIELKDALRLGLVVGVGRCLPRTRALEGQARRGQHARQMRRGDLDPQRAQMHGQPRQRPARQRHPLAVGTSTGDRHDPRPLRSGDPAGSPAPIVRVQRIQPTLVELVDDLAHVRLIRLPHTRDLRCRHARIRRQQDRCALTRREMLGTRRTALQRDRLAMRKRPNEHLRGTHHNLLHRDTSQFAAHSEFPVKHSEKDH
jgi:hypothetical protein